MERSTGKRIPELHPEPAPHAIRHVWRWYAELSAARSGSGFGPNPIAYGEIESWARLTATPIGAFEVSVIRRIDTVYLDTMAGHAREKQRQRKK